jgi:hypothetical protein
MGICLLRARVSRRVLAYVSATVSTVAVGCAASSAVDPSVASPIRETGRLPVASAARVVSVNLTTKLHLIGRPGHVENAKGTVSGTFSGTESAHFTGRTTSGVFEFTLYPSSGGSLSARAYAKGRLAGAFVYLSGTASVTGGTGRWAHASGNSLLYSATVDRQNFTSTSHLRGNISV